jgi:hypothetical protein
MSTQLIGLFRQAVSDLQIAMVLVAVLGAAYLIVRWQRRGLLVLVFTIPLPLVVISAWAFGRVAGGL